METIISFEETPVFDDLYHTLPVGHAIPLSDPHSADEDCSFNISYNSNDTEKILVSP